MSTVSNVPAIMSTSTDQVRSVEENTGLMVVFNGCNPDTPASPAALPGVPGVP